MRKNHMLPLFLFLLCFAILGVQCSSDDSEPAGEECPDGQVMGQDGTCYPAGDGNNWPTTDGDEEQPATDGDETATEDGDDVEDTEETDIEPDEQDADEGEEDATPVEDGDEEEPPVEDGDEEEPPVEDGDEADTVDFDRDDPACVSPDSCQNDDECCYGQYCNPAVNTCTSFCLKDDDCDNPTGCCDLAYGKCVACQTEDGDEEEDSPLQPCGQDGIGGEQYDAQCPTGMICDFGGYCHPGCDNDTNPCTVNRTCNNDPEHPRCVAECNPGGEAGGEAYDPNCPNGQVCLEANFCGVECSGNEDCAEGEVCNLPSDHPRCVPAK